MRINKYLAQATGLSRRAADMAIAAGQVSVNGRPAVAGQDVGDADRLTFNSLPVTPPRHTVTTLMLNKPAGYVVSRNGQGSKTVYDLLPAQYQALKPIGRLDKNSSGLLLLTNDGQLAYELTHPSRHKRKAYEVSLDTPLQPLHRQLISDRGIQLDDGLSRLQLARLREGDDTAWQVTMHEGRNRQIRRTFAALGYDVRRLHRTHFGPYALGNLPAGQFTQLPVQV
ncbi:MAG TPA: pseudouridine synthase [Candidatus Saccharimonadales bacterium]|nr:pseudouridine synthase [Candidatus Saccharimonadales bacterium]